MTNTKKQKVYASIIDEILDDAAPSYEGLQDAKKQGDEFHAITKDPSGQSLLEELAGHSHHTPVPGGGGVTASEEDWQGRAEKTLEGNSIIAAALKEAAGESTEGLEKKMLDMDQVKKKIDDLLHLGLSPKRVKAAIDKAAELQLFNRQFAHDYLDSRAGLVGLSYLEPNHFMPKQGSNGCVTSKEFIEKKGSIKAHSVKKIAACDGCKFASKQADGAMRCNLYKLPVVANEQELKAVVEDTAKKAGYKTANLKQAMIAIHNGEEASERAATLSRVDSPVVARSIGSMKQASQETFDASKVASLIKEGSSIEQAYVVGRSKVGSALAKAAIKSYVAAVKRSGAKVDLKQIDCSFLKNKLATQNAIIGASKCSSCTYRNGMHCGLTGGTLLTFPGMDKASGKKTASAELENKLDGNRILDEYGLDPSKVGVGDEIDMNGPEFMDIDENTTFSAGEIE